MTMLAAPLFRIVIAAFVILIVGGAVMVSVARRESGSAMAPNEARAEVNAIAARLPRLDGLPFDVRYSEGGRDEAVRLARLTKDAYEYFTGVFGDAHPSVIAMFLTPADWRRGYGMPSYDPPERRLRVATDDNPLWQSFGRIARVASPFGAYLMLKKIYADRNGDLELRRFFDLLAVHELAHAFEDHGGTAFPTLWLSEIYANLALHAFIAKTRPSELPYLTALPEAQTRIAVFNMMMRVRGYTSLDDFERHFPVGNAEEGMSAVNYGWYQIRFHVLAREVFDEGGEEALARLWAFGKREAARRGSSPYDYFREHGTIGWFERVPATDLVSRLASEVSPRLAQQVAAWH